MLGIDRGGDGTQTEPALRAPQADRPLGGRGGNTAGRRTDSWLLTWLSGSVAEAGWSGGSAQAAVGVEFVDDGVEVGQQKVGEVVAEAVAAHDPQHGKVLAVRGERVGRDLPATFAKGS